MRTIKSTLTLLESLVASAWTSKSSW